MRGSGDLGAIRAFEVPPTIAAPVLAAPLAAFFHASLDVLRHLVDADAFVEIHAALLPLVPKWAGDLFDFAGGDDAVAVLVQAGNELSGVKAAASAAVPAPSASVTITRRFALWSLGRKAPHHK